MTWHSQTPQSRTFERFFQTEAAGGVLLLLSTAAALMAANSAWASEYNRFWSVPVTVSISNHSLSLSLHQWIGDGLMTAFFLLMGLEIKREFVAGELSAPGQATLPIAGAIGGMVLPAVIYLLINRGGIEMRGWAIPMATDIAFALGALVLIAPAIPVGAKVFLTALAIVDDMGAVAVIALFHTHTLDRRALTFAALVFGLLGALNLARVRRLIPYLLLGVLLWLFMHQSGIHATIAGLLLALTIPTRTHINAAEFSAEARTLLDEFERTESGDYVVLTSKGQQDALIGLGRASKAVIAPLLRLEQTLHGISAFVIMPLFALSNAGVSFRGSPVNWPVLLGVVAGLALGKPLGITAAAFGVVKLKSVGLPNRVNWVTLLGCGSIGGIGFTMSLFIANLAFENTALLDSAKLGILGGSLMGALGAMVSLRLVSGRRSAA